MENEINALEHSIYMLNRKNLSISGVKDVISFDENGVSIITVMGNIAIKGKNIKIGNFNTDTGNMQMDGKFSAIFYLDDKGEKEGFFKRLWR